VAKNEVILSIKVDDKGTLSVVTKKAKKAAKGLDQVSKSTKRASSETAFHNKQQKGVANATANSTKAFSKMTTGISGGLVPAYAVLAANIFAITAAFGALSRASQLEILRKGLEFTGNAAGVNLGKVADGLRDITGSAVSAKEALTTVALGVSAGFDSKQLEGLTRVAKGASLALGRDMEDALSRLARGAAKLEPEILDELGIMVRLDDATENYAAAIGKTAAQLSQFERRQAFVNAIIKQGEQKFGALSEAIEASPYDQLAASFKDLAENGLTLINTLLGPLIKLLSTNPKALLGILVLFGSTIVKSMIPSLSNMTQKAQEAAKATAAMNAVQVQSVASLRGVSKGVQNYQTKLAAGTETQEDHTKAVRSARMSYVRNTSDLDRLTDSGGRFNKTWVRKRVLVANSTKALNALTLSTFKSNLAATAQNTIQGVNLIQTGHTIAGWRILTGVMAQQVKVMGAGLLAAKGWGKANILLAGSATLAATALKGLGATIATWLPWVGIIIVSFSMLKDFILPLFSSELSGLEKAMKKAKEGTEQFAKTNEQLSTLLSRDSITGVNAYAATLNAMAGELREGATSITSIVDELDKELQTKLKAIAHKQELLQQVLSSSGAGTIEAERLRQEVAQATLSAPSISAEDVVSILDLANKQLDSLNTKILDLGATGKVSSKGLGSLMDQASLLRTAILAAASGSLTGEQAIKRVESAMKEASAATSEFHSNIKGAADLTSDVNALFVQLDKPTGPLASRVELLDRLAEAVLKAKEVPEILEHLEGALGDFGTNAQGINQYAKDIKELNKRLEGTKQVLKESAQKAAELRSTGRVENLLKAEEELRKGYTETIAANQRALDIAQLRDKEETTAIAVIAEQRKQIAASNLRSIIIVLKNNVKLAKEELGRLTIAKQIVQAQGNIEKELQKQLSTEIKIAKANATSRGLGTLTPQQELKFSLLAAEAKIAAAKSTAELARKTAEIELKVLAAKHGLLIAEFALTNQIISPEEQAVLTATSQLIAAQQVLLGLKIKSADQDIVSAEAAEKALKAEGLGAAGEGLIGGTLGTLSDIQALIATIGKEGVNKLFDEATFTAKTTFVKAQYQGMIDIAKTLGPEGELIASVAEGAFLISEAFGNAFDHIEAGGSKVVAGLMVMQGAINAIAGMRAAKSKAAIAGIDNEIAAEKRRDGVSVQSVAKLKALEVKKEKAKRKAFEQDKKMKMAQVVMSTAAAIMSAIQGPPGLPWSAVFGAAAAVMGAAQLSAISSMTYQGGGSSAPSAPSKISIGERSSTIDLATSRSPSGELANARGESGVSTGSNFIPTFTGRAAGGTVGVRVGEQGPEELFVPERSHIIPADDTEQLANSSSNVTFTINAIDAQGVEDVLVGQRQHIINMIRESANDRGEFFLEDIE